MQEIFKLTMDSLIKHDKYVLSKNEQIFYEKIVNANIKKNDDYKGGLGENNFSDEKREISFDELISKLKSN